MAIDSEEELQTSNLSQLETCLQCSPIDVCYFNGIISSLFKNFLLMVETQSNDKSLRESCFLGYHFNQVFVKTTVQENKDNFI